MLVLLPINIYWESTKILRDKRHDGLCLHGAKWDTTQKIYLISYLNCGGKVFFVFLGSYTQHIFHQDRKWKQTPSRLRRTQYFKYLVEKSTCYLETQFHPVHLKQWPSRFVIHSKKYSLYIACHAWICKKEILQEVFILTTCHILFFPFHFKKKKFFIPL